MPAIPMLLQLLIAAFFLPDILRRYGANATQADLTNGFSGIGAMMQSLPTQPGATAEPSKPPTAAQTLNDAVNKPTSLLFGGVLLFGGAVLFSQGRAAFHEVSETTRDVYNEGSRVSRAASGADGGPRNYSRRAKN